LNRFQRLGEAFGNATKKGGAMKITVGILAFTALTGIPSAQEALRLGQNSEGQTELSWRGSSQFPDGSIRRPFFEVERSADLSRWEPFGERMRARSTESLRLHLGLEGGAGFFRLREFEPGLNRLASDSAEVFGYGEAFQNELRTVGQISLDEFTGMFALTNQFLEKLTWDPRTARFWSDFDGVPAELNRGKTTASPGYRYSNFRLNDAELRVFLTNGFVVSERLGGMVSSFGQEDSFADLFYRIWFDDLPVFVSTDAILQAWHRTYDGMLAEVEETFLSRSLDVLLAEIAAKLPEVWAAAGEGVLKESIRDADFYLAVARSLLRGEPVPSTLDQDSRVAAMLSDIRSYALKKIELFGECRTVDFSQFSPRGHYLHTEGLKRYFQCSMWLGRMDFMLAGEPLKRCPDASTAITPREIGSAVVLWDLLQRAGEFRRWKQIDKVIGSFVGWSDSLGFGQLGGVLAAAGIRSVLDVPNLATLERLQAEVMAGELGIQNIRSDYIVSPFGPQQAQLPRVFLFLGQRFTPDSWALSQTVFDSILWEQNGFAEKVERRVPSALDVAFAVFGNDHLVPMLAQRIANTNALRSLIHAERWRDGLPYQHNLAAVRRVIDSQERAAWDSNIYMSWLQALRQLSLPTTDPKFPEAMRTRAWAMKTLNTQLASWTHLRHDNVLYVKQSYTSAAVCFYPHGFVEPRVEFWESLRDTAVRAAELIAALPYEGEYTYSEARAERGTNFIWTVTWSTNTVPLTVVQDNQTAHLRRFASVVSRLAELSSKELAQEPFNQQDDDFIKELIQNAGSLPLGSGSVKKYDGWFPRLFYRPLPYLGLHNYTMIPEVYFQETFGANASDRVVVDVHTDVPSLGDPGGVLHQGVGTPNMMLVAIDNGPDRMIYAGPVLSHYEFEIVGEPYRMTDFEWEEILMRDFRNIGGREIQGVAPPEWTRSYLVPR
jgi:hypothetical protein